MKLIGIGTDIVEISRIQRLLGTHPQRFAERLLHPHELKTFAEAPHQAAWLAKRFATKEAVAKALGTGIGAHAHLTGIETRHLPSGQPQVVLHGVTLATAERRGVREIALSLADEREYAVAFVILTG